jgi:hypothetical protein
MRIFKFFLIIGLVGLLALPADAQLTRRKIKKNNKAMQKFKGQKNTFTKEKQYSYLAFSVNINTYHGDIAPNARWGSTKLGFARPGLTASYGYRFGPRYTAKASLSHARIQSDDNIVADPGHENNKYRYIRNAHFRNDIWEFSLMTIFDLFKNSGSYLSRVDWTPYAFIGAGIYHHNPKARVPEEYILPADPSLHYSFDNAGEWVSLQPLGTEGQFSDLQETDANYGIEPYKLWQFSIPVGIGIRYKLMDALDISADISLKILFTDYIDDVSRHYVDMGVLDNDLARAMSNRSRDPVSATGNSRNLTEWPTTIITGRDGIDYELIPGFGHEGFSNNRGGKANDLFYVTSFRIAYIIGGRFRRAKFR